MPNNQKASSGHRSGAKTQSRMISLTASWLLVEQTLYYISTGRCQNLFHLCRWREKYQLSNFIKTSLCCSLR